MKHERVSRLWVALIPGWTKERNTDVHHTSRMVKFDLPKGIENNKENAIHFYLNCLDTYSTMSEDRMINSADLEPSIVKLITYKTYVMPKATYECRQANYGKIPSVDVYLKYIKNKRKE